MLRFLYKFCDFLFDPRPAILVIRRAWRRAVFAAKVSAILVAALAAAIYPEYLAAVAPVAIAVACGYVAYKYVS